MKQHLKQTLKEILDLVRPYKKGILSTLALIALFSQFSTVSYYLAKHASPRDIVGTYSDDGGAGIRTATRTTWWKGNHFYPYGNVYYRIVHTFNDLAPKTFPLENLPEEQKEEKSNHYSLMIVSLLSLYALAFLFASQIAKSLLGRLAATFVLVTSLLQAGVWLKYILIPHPDHTLAFMIAAAAILSAKFMEKPESKLFFNASAAMWGVATATKFTTILLYPAILFLFVFPFSKDKVSLNNIKRFAQYVLVMFLSYQIIGFPQNLMMHKHISFLLWQSHYSVSPDMQSTMEWLTLGWQQIRFPALAIFLLAALLAPRSERQPTKKVVIFFLLPLAVLFSRKITSAHEHYPIPFVAMTLTGLVVLLPQLNFQRFFNRKTKIAGLTALLAAAMFFLNPRMEKTLAQQEMVISECFDEAKTVASILFEKQNKSELVMVDPYFPVGDRNKEHIRKWGYSLVSLENPELSAIGLREKFYQRYLSPAPKTEQPDQVKVWDEKTAFYKLFHNNEEVFYKGQVWRRIYHDQCGFSVFEKQKN